jgi:hypothetical protein
MREPADVEIKLTVGDRAHIARLALEDQRGLVLTRGAKVAVDAVLRHVERAAHEPSRVRGLPFKDLLERAAPYEQLLGLPAQNFSGELTDSA